MSIWVRGQRVPVPFWHEFNLPWHLLSVFASMPELLRLSSGEPHPVILLPGLGAGDSTMLPLKWALQGLGYPVRTWGLGPNTGQLRALSDAVNAQVTARASSSGEKVTLIGWSFGGVVARQVARRSPEAVKQVITLGTPIFDHELTPVEVPILSLYSRMDGVVPWQQSIDHLSEQVQNVHVHSTHMGLGYHPLVLRLVADQLAFGSVPVAGSD